LVDNDGLLAESFVAYDGFLKQNDVLDNTEDGRAVREVGENLRHAAEEWAAAIGRSDYLEGYEWEYHLVESPEVNAWCMPGGKIVVYTGILSVAQNRNGLATVMGHELAHALASHGRARQSAELLKTGGAIATALIGFLSGADGETQYAANNIYDTASTYLGTLPFSRAHEVEADEIGLMLMQQAGYDPQEAVHFWERMSEVSGDGPPEFMSTHPSDERRIENLRRLVVVNGD
jgi:predicted Zn-dependent protease